MTKNTRLPAWRWFIIALFVLCPVQWISVARSPWLAEPPKPVGDGPDYENIAYHLWLGQGWVIDSTSAGWREIYTPQRSQYNVHLDSPPRQFPTTGRPPLFPTIVAGIYSLLGRNAQGFAAVRLFSASCLALAGALAVGMTAWLLTPPSELQERSASRCQVRGGSTYWLAAGAGGTLFYFAVNRTLRDYATDFLTEPLALLLMQVFVILALLACSVEAYRADTQSPLLRTTPLKTQWWLVGLSGGAFGCLILTRSMFVVWLPAIWLIFYIALPYARGRRLQLATLAVVMACLVCTPWWVRNCIVLQRIMPLGTQGATTLLGGYSDAALAGNGDWQAEPELQLRQEFLQRPEVRRLPSDMEREVALAKEASLRVRRWVAAHVWDLPGLIAARIYVHWNPYWGASLLWKIPLVVGVLRLLLGRGILAPSTSRPNRDRTAKTVSSVRPSAATLWLLGLPLTSTVVVAAFYSTGGRFLVPLYGVLFVLAGLGLAYITSLLVVDRSADQRQ